jgi:hypothetical protein
MWHFDRIYRFRIHYRSDRYDLGCRAVFGERRQRVPAFASRNKRPPSASMHKRWSRLPE